MQIKNQMKVHSKIRVFKNNTLKAYDSEDVNLSDIVSRSRDIKVYDSDGFYMCKLEKGK